MSRDKSAVFKSIFSKLLLERNPDGSRKWLSIKEMNFLIDEVTEVLKSEPSILIELEPPVVLCGDTHGQFYDLLRLFDHGGWPPDTRYLFLGDYVDRGTQSLEVICTMFAFKVVYPMDFHILRGNHECANINRSYGFYDECKRRYSEDLFFKFNAAFNYLPLAGLVGDRIFCMHGGLSPHLQSLDQLRAEKRPVGEVYGGMFADLMWSDPDPNVTGFALNNRGISYKFGVDAVSEFCDSNNLDLIVRAHQVVMEGYEFFVGGRLVTIFSAPKYCDQFDNCAAMIKVSKELHCSIKVRLINPMKIGRN